MSENEQNKSNKSDAEIVFIKCSECRKYTNANLIRDEERERILKLTELRIQGFKFIRMFPKDTVRHFIKELDELKQQIAEGK